MVPVTVPLLWVAVFVFRASPSSGMARMSAKYANRQATCGGSVHAGLRRRVDTPNSSSLFNNVDMDGQQERFFSERSLIIFFVLPVSLQLVVEPATCWMLILHADFRIITFLSVPASACVICCCCCCLGSSERQTMGSLGLDEPLNGSLNSILPLVSILTPKYMQQSITTKKNVICRNHRCACDKTLHTNR